MNAMRHALVIGALALLTACGGGGGGSGTSPLVPGSGGAGPGSTPIPVASDLILQASSTQLANTGSATVTLTVTAVDASRVVVPNVPVQLAVDGDAVISQSGPATGTGGTVTGQLSIGSSRANRVVTVTATSGAVTKSVQVQVVGTRIASTLVPAILAPGAAGEVQYRVVDQSGNPMVGQEVSVSAPGLSPSSGTGTTGSNGDYSFRYTAATSPGTFRIAMTAGGVTDEQSISVQGTSGVSPVDPAIVISAANVSANPSVVGVNTVGASTTNRSEIRALFLTANNVPVRNVRVRFDLAGDTNSIGGSFSTGSSILYSDANGFVTTAYIPGTRSSPTDGVTVRACYGKTDAEVAAPSCPNAATVRLTVVSEPLGVSIGTNELIVVTELTYTKRFLISVADSAGNAKGDVALSVSLDLPQFRKGFYEIDNNRWSKFLGDQDVCVNEDANRNGVLEASEDLNGNGRLDPGRSDVIVRLVDTRTRADGTAVAEITYAKSFASWVDAWLTVAASGVSGTEGRATFKLDPIPPDAASINAVATSPAYRRSPYGLLPGCNNSN